jgi:glutathione peroxidase
MKQFSKIALFCAVLVILSAFKADVKKIVYDFTVEDINGKKVNLSDYKGKTLLIVNVASKCGLTPQYADLQAFYEKYKDQGLEILAFPANNFMGQEPGSNEDIKSFCKDTYKVTFPMFSKISVQGKDIHPLYKYLTQKSENGKLDAPVKWNFQKFIINKEGKVVDVITPRERVSDEEIEKRIIKYLN